MGGKNDNGSTLGNFTVNNIATTTGIKIETSIISLLYLIGSDIIFYFNNFNISSLSIEISSFSPELSTPCLKSIAPL